MVRTQGCSTGVLPPTFDVDMAASLIVKTNGKLLLKNGNLAWTDGPPTDTCCCQSGSGSGLTCCCSFDVFGGDAPTPNILTATISDITGDCIGCLPASVALPRSVDIWSGSEAACGGDNLDLSLTCDPGSPNCDWGLTAACGAAPPPPFTLTLLSCSPLHLITVVSISLGASHCCSGSFVVEITE